MIQNDTKSLVPIIYFEMLSLRLFGMTYAEIAAKTKYSESHIRRLFAKNGAMHEIWLSYRREAKNNFVDDAINMLFANLPDVTRKLIETAKSNNRGSNEAAKLIMHYTLGKPQENVNEAKPEAPAEPLPLTIIQEKQIITAFRNFRAVEKTIVP